MKRTLATLMALCMMLSLAACGGSGASSVPASVSASAPSSGSEPAPADGAVLNIWCWNDEFQSRFNDYYPEVKAVAEDKSTTTLNDGTIVKWTINPNENNNYQNKLDEALLAQDSAAADDKIDIFLIEADYALKYVDSEYTLDVKKDVGLTDDDQLVVSFWGSMGAKYMNEHMAGELALECKNSVPYHHVHATGAAAREWLPRMAKEQGADFDAHPNIEVTEYIYDMATVMRAADLVICRAGASTLSELTALGVPAILVPSPNVTNHHQEKNAALLGDHGAALVLPEEGLDGKKLFAAAAGILNDPQRMETMSQNMAALGIPDATKRIYDTVMTLLK